MSTSHVTTHVLDAVTGTPAPGIAVRLERQRGAEWTPVGSGTTNADGRISDLGPERLEVGTYRIVFDTGEYFERTGRDAFYPRVVIDFRLSDASKHYHVPVLLSPFSFSTYRGS